MTEKTCYSCLHKQRLKARQRRLRDKQSQLFGQVRKRSAAPPRVNTLNCTSCKRCVSADKFKIGYKTCVACLKRKSSVHARTKLAPSAPYVLFSEFEDTFEFLFSDSLSPLTLQSELSSIDIDMAKLFWGRGGDCTKAQRSIKLYVLERLLL